MPEAPEGSVAPGRALVTQRALVDIVRGAVLSSYGVTGLGATSPLGSVRRRVGLGEPAIRVTLEPDLGVDIRLRIAYGLPVAEVARQVDSAVRYALRRALRREIGTLTIHVDGLEGRAFTTSGPSAEAAKRPRTPGEDTT